MQRTTTSSGWELIAENEGAASIVGAVLDLDAEKIYTRSELAEAAGVPLKELYLSETVSTLADVGLLRPVDNEGELTYAIEDGSDVYERAAAFEEVVAARHDRDS